MVKHNKKRNVGLLLEFFSRYIAKATLEKDSEKAERALQIMNEFFNKNTQLSKELKAFNTLYESKLKNKETAYSLMKNIKTYCKKEIDVAKLQKEKTNLIHEINKALDESFFDMEIPTYKSLANVHILMNCWRSQKMNEIQETAKFEDKILEHIVENKNISPGNSKYLEYTEDEIDSLVIHVMNNKLNERYGTTLSDKQKELLQLYVFANESSEQRLHLLACLEELKTSTISLLESECSHQDKSNKEDYLLKENLQKTKKALNDFKVSLNNIDDESIMFFMNVAKIREEMLDK
jgi:hypothetical protein